MTYEIYIEEDNPYGTMRGIRPSDSTPDDRQVFTTFKQAKQELLAVLQADEDELRERLLLLQFNRHDVHQLRKNQLRKD